MVGFGGCGMRLDLEGPDGRRTESRFGGGSAGEAFPSRRLAVRALTAR